MNAATQALLIRFLTECPDRSIVTVSVGLRVECVLTWGRNHAIGVGDDEADAIARALDTWSRSVQRMRASVREMLAVCGVAGRTEATER